jgi:hypothetical protein
MPDVLAATRNHRAIATAPVSRCRLEVKTKTAVVAILVGVVIGAIALIAANWPQLPARTLPKPPITYVAMGGQPVDVPSKGCLAPMIAELQKRPNWVVRIDDMRWTDYTQGDDDPKHGEIVIEAAGATWQSAWLPSQTLPLTNAERASVLAAFDLSCKQDESMPHGGYEGRYIAVAYGRIGKAAAQIDYNSPATLRFGELFEAIRGRYIANRASAAKNYVVKVSGLLRNNPEWTKKEEIIDSTKYQGSDEDRVDFLDWVLTQPQTLPKNKNVATGTLTMEGITRHIAIKLDRLADANRVLERTSLASELLMWMTVNRED